MRRLTTSLLLLLVALLSGCRTYHYKITDNQTGKTFYKALAAPPTDLPASIALTDPATGSVTVTTSYTVEPVSESEYDRNRPVYVPR